MRTRPRLPPRHVRRLAGPGVALAVLLLTFTACASDGSDDASGDDGSSATTAEETTTTTTGGSTTTATVERPELPEGREIEVQVPTDYDADMPAPLVVLLHGFGVDGPVQNAYFRLGEVADENGMLAVFPSGHRERRGPAVLERHRRVLRP